VVAAWDSISAQVTPTWYAAGIYFAYLGVQVPSPSHPFKFSGQSGFHLLQALFAYIMPGLEMKSRADDTNTVMVYYCNAYAAWYVDQARPCLMRLLYD
jgi:hypothetical protein